MVWGGRAPTRERERERDGVSVLIFFGFLLFFLWGGGECSVGFSYGKSVKVG